MGELKQMEEPTGKTSQFEKIEAFLKRNYQIRNNAIKCKPEIYLSGQWVPITKYIANSIKRSIASQLEKAPSISYLFEVIESDAFEIINPIQKYFETLPPHRGSDYIRQLVNTLQPANHEELETPQLKEQLYKNFKKWIVATVATVMEVDKINHTCLVLTGAQGIFKTTWLNNLCPPVLNPYLYSNHINLQSKDSQTLLAECFLINIDDQLKQINTRDENEIKNIITAPFVKYRRPYDTHIQEYPRIASFCASVNGNDFLTDPTGSRRFLPFEIEAIDIQTAKKIDINNVWAQAYSHYKAGFKYYFDREEIEAMHLYNKTFQFNSQESEALNIFFEPVEEHEFNYAFLPNTKYDKYYHLSTSAILSIIQNELGNMRLTIKRMGEALQRADFKKRQASAPGTASRSWGWFVKLKMVKDKTDFKTQKLLDLAKGIETGSLESKY